MIRSLKIRILVLTHSLAPLYPQIAIALVKVEPDQFHNRWVVYKNIHSLQAESIKVMVNSYYLLGKWGLALQIAS